jgi:protoheme IX farnesyltransferase
VKDAGLDRPASLAFPLAPVGLRHRLADYAALVKPRLNALVVASAMVGFYLGSNGPIDLILLLNTAMGAALVAGGSAGLNQVFERDTDRLMARTRLRPLPDGRLTSTEARVFSYAAAAAGVAQLALAVNATAALVALATLVVYIWIYTPLKLRTPVATLVGAVPGALPPLIGWAGARGVLSLEAWTLFAIVFCWQIPHFLAIAWLYREDYRRAGFPMLSTLETDGRRTGGQSVVFATLLVAAAASPYMVGLAGATYLAAALMLSLALLGLAVRFALRRSDGRARGLFIGSLVYLTVLWIVLLVDKI